MSSQQETVDYLVKQMASAGVITARKMFGEYGVYCNGTIVALVCDDQLYVKPTVAGRRFLETPEEAPPYPGAKNYFLITEDSWADGEWLGELIKISLRELVASKKR